MVNPILIENASPNAEYIFVDTAANNIELDWLLSPTEETAKQKEKKPVIKSLSIWDHHSGTEKRLKAYKSPKKRGFKGPEFDVRIDPSMPSAAQFVWTILNEDQPVPDVLEFVGKMEPTTKGEAPQLQTTAQFAVAAYIDSEFKANKDNIPQAYDGLCKMSLSDLASSGRALLRDQFNALDLMRAKTQYTQLEILPGVTKTFPIIQTDPKYIGRVVNPAMLELGRDSLTGIAALWRVENQSGQVFVSFRSDGDHPNVENVVEHLKTILPGTFGSGHDEASVLIFPDLRSFANSIPLFDKEEAVKRAYEKPSFPSPSPEE